MKRQDDFKTAVTMTVVWVAGLTLLVIFGSLMAGQFLDKVLDSKPIFTIVFIIASIPVTLILTLRVVKKPTARISQVNKEEISEEVPHRGKDN
jgi:F0F1-type ATP synthase assembly protein I